MHVTRSNTIYACPTVQYNICMSHGPIQSMHVTRSNKSMHVTRSNKSMHVKRSNTIYACHTSQHNLCMSQGPVQSMHVQKSNKMKIDKITLYYYTTYLVTLYKPLKHLSTSTCLLHYMYNIICILISRVG